MLYSVYLPCDFEGRPDGRESFLENYLKTTYTKRTYLFSFFLERICCCSFIVLIYDKYSPWRGMEQDDRLVLFSPMDDTKSYIITSVTDNMTNYHGGRSSKRDRRSWRANARKPFESKKMATHVYQRTASLRVWASKAATQSSVACVGVDQKSWD